MEVWGHVLVHSYEKRNMEFLINGVIKVEIHLRILRNYFANVRLCSLLCIGDTAVPFILLPIFVSAGSDV